jgi:hypothetical protein
MADKVTMTAFENELGVQAPVGFWDPAGVVSFLILLDFAFGFITSSYLVTLFPKAPVKFVS